LLSVVDRCLLIDCQVSLSVAVVGSWFSGRVSVVGSWLLIVGAICRHIFLCRFLALNLLQVLARGKVLWLSIWTWTNVRYKKNYGEI
jgi:hypothetical protein